jgi:sugar O-acyltransferase (sialic acid O-acetyltransferase NeuD family)
MRRLLILGAGGHGRALADLAGACGFTVAGFTEPGGRGRDVLGTDEDLLVLVARHSLDGAVVGVGATALGVRRALFERIGATGVATPALVHPRATASASARLGPGAVVFAGSVLGAGVEVGANAVVYSGVVVEHDSRVGDHAWLSPGAVLSGGVTVEAGAFLGAGAVVVPGVTIGRDAVVAAGAVVIAEVPAGTTVVGVPARPRGTA